MCFLSFAQAGKVMATNVSGVATEPLIGAVVGEIGRGAFGTVLKVVKPDRSFLDRCRAFAGSHPTVTAIKCFPPAPAGCFPTALVEEHTRLQKVQRSECTVQFLGVREVPPGAIDAKLGDFDKHVLEFGYCNAGTLQNEIEERAKIGMSFSQQELFDLAWRLLYGVAQLHADKVIHRDIAPRNVLLNRHGVLTDVKLCDFGLAKDANDDTKHSKPKRPSMEQHPELNFDSAIVVKTVEHPAVFDLFAVGVCLVQAAQLKVYTDADDRAHAMTTDKVLADIEAVRPQYPMIAEAVKQMLTVTASSTLTPIDIMKSLQRAHGV